MVNVLIFCESCGYIDEIHMDGQMWAQCNECEDSELLYVPRVWFSNKEQAIEAWRQIHEFAAEHHLTRAAMRFPKF